MDVISLLTFPSWASACPAAVSGLVFLLYKPSAFLFSRKLIIRLGRLTDLLRTLVSQYHFLVMEGQWWCSKTDINVQSSVLQSGYTFWCQGPFVCLSQSPQILHTGWLPSSFIFSTGGVIWLDNKLSHHVILLFALSRKTFDSPLLNCKVSGMCPQPSTVIMIKPLSPRRKVLKDNVISAFVKISHPSLLC